MARFAAVPAGNLELGAVLAAERYDPRRTGAHTGRVFSAIARIVNDQVTATRGETAFQYVVLDTTHAQDGMIRAHGAPLALAQLGSAKKVVQPGDVIISRLRPYLRQVGYVDGGLFAAAGERVRVVCSTEFFVLRSADGESLAFLVPYLLSDPVQEWLSASQEGGHHPRFNREALERLPVPEWLLDDRMQLAESVEASIAAAREADLALRSLIAECSRLWDGV
jgi:hypothetical protein